MTELNVPLLAAIIAVGFVVESMLGFGSAIVSLSLGSLWWPVQRIVPFQVALGLVVSAYLVLRYRRDIAVRHLGTVYLPMTFVGLVAGLLLTTRLGPASLDKLFGAVVLVLAALQLGRAVLGGSAIPLRWPARSAALFGAGVMHGLYAIGGPLVVYVTSREPFQKGMFRATLSALWLVLGGILFAQLAATGRYAKGDAFIVAALLIPVALGTFTGEWLHSRVADRPFRLVVMSLLVIIGGKLAWA